MNTWSDIKSNRTEQKTADEMFRELGYSKYDATYSDGNYYIGMDALGYVVKWYSGKDGFPRNAYFTPEEILAFAQLIKELEAKGNAEK